MLSIITLSLFIIGLMICVALDMSLVYALVFGYILFFTFGLIKKKSAKELLNVSWKSIVSVKNILIVFMLIGILTAVWRAGGTIPFIIYYSTKLIRPEIFILMSFLLCCLLSFLTGTAFGTAATMGVICMTMARTLGANELFVGGAIMSGIFFGDRCSPMSTSALLVSQLTKTSIFDNIRLMFKTSAIPFILTAALYLVIGFSSKGEDASLEMAALFADNFHLTLVTVVPAVLIIVLSLFKINVKTTMSISILVGIAICIVVQGVSPDTLLHYVLTGYTTPVPELATMINGGGIKSMLKVFAIVCISSSFSGIFELTGLLDGINKYIEKMASRLSVFGSMLATSFLTGMISCNQTLAIILTSQLTSKIEPDQQMKAIHLENTVVLVSALVPWSIAGAVPLNTIEAPTICLLTAFYIYLVPLYNLLLSYKDRAQNT